MGIWQFTLTETPHGYQDHAKHHNRRKIAWVRAGLITPPITPVTNSDREGDVGEWQSPSGVWNYTWKVNDPSDNNVFALVRVFEEQNPQSVYVSSGPTRLVTQEQWAAQQDLSVKLLEFDDSGIT